MSKPIVFRECPINELVLGDKHVHYGSANEQTKQEHAEREIEDVSYEEINPLCRYLDIEKIKQKNIRKPAEVQEMLEKKSKEDANTFATFLRELIGLKYMNFHGDHIATVFANLREDLPMMRDYSLNNFYTYFRDAPL